MKHYTLDDRLRIQRGLTINLNFTEIGNSIGKNRTSVSREIQAHYRGEGKPARSKCRHRNDCIFKDPSECPAPSCSKRTCSIACSQCARYCDRYEPEICPKLMKPPYVCNGCEHRAVMDATSKKGSMMLNMRTTSTSILSQIPDPAYP